jgi:hypothetical protein
MRSSPRPPVCFRPQAGRCTLRFQRQMMVNWTLLSMMPALMA